MRIDSRPTRGSGDDILARATALLDVIADHPAGATVNDLAEKTGIPVSTTYRLLVRLQALSLIAPDEGEGSYRVSTRAIRWGAAGRQRLRPRAAALPAMHRLREQFGETVQLAVRDGLDAVFIDSVESDHSFRLHVQAGQRFPLHAGATARVMLAHAPDHVREQSLRPERLTSLGEHTITDPDELLASLEQIRARGFAVSSGEIYVESIAVAAPFFDESGELLGVIGVSAPTTRLTPDAAAHQVAPALIDAADSVSLTFGHVSGNGSRKDMR